jgi:beta-mannanase
VVPVSPSATQQAKNLLCYLYSIKGNHVLSGQQEANWNATPTDIAWYTSNGLKYPAILGSDFLYRGSASCAEVTASTTRAIAYWNAGGITMFRYHMGMPGSGLTCTSDCYQGANCAEPTTVPTAAFFTNVVTPGTAENTSLNAKLDYVAVQISAMEAANVPIILALFHETQANGWFWWAETASGPAFINLWQYAFNYLTVTHGLTNIVWLMPFSGSPSAAFYPGKAFVDIGGPDEYTEPTNLLTFTASGNYAPATAALGTTMPMTLHETGSALQPDSMFPNPTAPWIMWNVWATYENTTISGFTYNTVASMTAAYGSQYTITRDEIPDLN